MWHDSPSANVDTLEIYGTYVLNIAFRDEYVITHEFLVTQMQMRHDGILGMNPDTMGTNKDIPTCKFGSGHDVKLHPRLSDHWYKWSPPPRSNGLLEGWRFGVPSCPWSEKLPLKAEELLSCQRHKMEKATGNHSTRLKAYSKKQQLQQDEFFVKRYSRCKIIPQSDLQVGTPGDVALLRVKKGWKAELGCNVTTVW